MNGLKHFSKKLFAVRWADQYELESSYDEAARVCAQKIVACGGIDFSNKNQQYADLGCGHGAFTATVNKVFGFNKVVCVDGSEEMLKILRGLTPRFNGVELEIFHQDIEHTSLPLATSSTSIITCCRTISYLKILDTLFAEVSRALVPGGIFSFNFTCHTDTNCEVILPTGLHGYLHSKRFVQHTAEQSNLSFVNAYMSASDMFPGEENISNVLLLLRKT